MSNLVGEVISANLCIGYGIRFKFILCLSAVWEVLPYVPPNLARLLISFFVLPD